MNYKYLHLAALALLLQLPFIDCAATTAEVVVETKQVETKPVNSTPTTKTTATTTTTTTAPTLVIQKRRPRDDKINFGSKIIVNVKNHISNNKFHRLAIFPRNADVTKKDTEHLWFHMCVNNNEQTETEAEAKTEEKCSPYGTYAFSGISPLMQYGEHKGNWPINPGNKKVCIINTETKPYTNIGCENFTIDSLSLSTTKESTIEPSRSMFYVGESITATFYAKEKIPNTWVGLYKSNSNNYEPYNIMDEYIVAKPMMWLYSGCNDQEHNKNCLRTKNRGTVQFDQTSEKYSSSEWSEVVAGSYRLCMVFYNNAPYKKFVCSNDFQVGSPITSIEAIPSSEDAADGHWPLTTFEFGEAIKLRFSNDEPRESNWVAIYLPDADTEDDYEQELWANMCGHQNKYDYCQLQSSGEVSFYGRNPEQAENSRWPLRPKQYKACLMDGKKEPFLELDCVDIEVKKVIETAITDSTLTPLEPRFNVGDPIIANFYSAVPTQNTWVGLYKSNKADNTMSEIPEPLMWLYSACNGQEGDGNCFKKASVGMIEFDQTTEDYSREEWSDIVAGEYRLCMSFYNDRPFTKFICSDTFTVGEVDLKEKEVILLESNSKSMKKPNLEEEKARSGSSFFAQD